MPASLSLAGDRIDAFIDHGIPAGVALCASPDDPTSPGADMRRTAGILCGGVLLLAACSGESVHETGVEADAPATTAISPAADAEAVPVEAAPCSPMIVDEVTATAGLAVVESRDERPIACVYDFGEDVGVANLVSVENGEGRSAAPAASFADYMARVAEGSAGIVP